MDILGVQAFSGFGSVNPYQTTPSLGATGATTRACCPCGSTATDPTSSMLASQMAMTQTMMTMLLMLLVQLMTGGQAGGALQGILGGTGGGTGTSGTSGTTGTSGTSGSTGTTGSSGTTAYDPNAGGSNVARPNGHNAIVSTFGQPGDRSNLVTMKMPAGPGGKMVSVTAHKKIAGKMKAAFEEIKAKGLSDEIKSFDGTYNNRNKRGGSTKSTHAWGIAVDLNASQYPMGTSASKTSARYKQIAAIMEKYGFHQISTDPMHFQYATGY